METEELAALFERVVIGAVGLTARALADAAPGIELTFPQWRVLVIVGESERGARISDVAARVAVTIPATSRLLRRLQRRGLVALEPDERDGRATRARLTAEGGEVRDRIFAYRREVLRVIVGEMAGTASDGLPNTMALMAEHLRRFT